MGKQLFDQYSLLHYSTGVVAYFWGIPVVPWLFLHIGFEVVENSEPGMRFINTNLKTFWPGGKPRADSFENIVGDNISTVIGWYCAKFLDDYGKENNWY